MSTLNPILYPQITRVPGQDGASDSPRRAGETPIQKGEFDQSLEQALQKNESKETSLRGQQASLQSVQTPLKFSAHAMQRLRERNIHFDTQLMAKLNEALQKADAKGVQDTLVLTDQSALIVNVPNRTVITAMDRQQLSGNVFTNIDGAVII